MRALLDHLAELFRAVVNQILFFLCGAMMHDDSDHAQCRPW